MSHHAPRLEDLVLSRRELLCRSGMGMGALALGGLLSEQGLLDQAARGGDLGVASAGMGAAPGAANPLLPRSAPLRAGPSVWSIFS